MRLAGVRPPEDDEIRVLDLLVGAGAAARSEDRRQTDDAGSVSGAVAAVDVVAAHDLPGELLCDEVHLVRGLRAAEHADAFAPCARGAGGTRPRPGRGPRPRWRCAAAPFSDGTSGSVSRVSGFRILSITSSRSPNRTPMGPHSRPLVARNSAVVFRYVGRALPVSRGRAPRTAAG